ncbi:MAG TPA: hypothetical protein VGL80_29435 [Pseudonocardiaceae bacterium]
MSATLAVAAHALAGGGLPATGLTVVLTLGLAAIGVAIADRRRSTGTILAVLGAAQLVTHVLLSLSPMHMAGDVVIADGAPRADSAGMLGAHVIAVLVSAVLLAKADAAVFLITAVLAMLLPSLLIAPPVPSAPAGARPHAVPQDRSISVLLRRSHARRGPPVTA